MRIVPGPCVGGDCRLTAEADCPPSLPSPRSLKDRGGSLQYHPLKVTGRSQGTQVLEVSSLGLQISLGLSDLLGQLFPAVAEPIQAERLCYRVKQSFIWTDTLGCLKGPSARQQQAFLLLLYRHLFITWPLESLSSSHLAHPHPSVFRAGRLCFWRRVADCLCNLTRRLLFLDQGEVQIPDNFCPTNPHVQKAGSQGAFGLTSSVP